MGDSSIPLSDEPIITTVYTPSSQSTSFIAAYIGDYKLWVIYSKDEVYVSDRDTYDNLWRYRKSMITKEGGKIYIQPKDKKQDVLELKLMK